MQCNVIEHLLRHVNLDQHKLQLIFQVPKNFKNMTSRAQKMYKKLLDPEPTRRLSLCDIEKYLDDRWLRKGFNKPEDEQSQLTLGSFQVN